MTPTVHARDRDPPSSIMLDWRPTMSPRSLQILRSSALLLLALFVLTATRAAARDTCTYTQQSDVPATMRDGTILRSNVFTPNEPGNYPVILLRLPYNK